MQKVSGGETARFEAYHPISADDPKWRDVTVAPILGADGKVERMIAVSRDITERHQYEAQFFRSSRLRIASRTEATSTSKRSAIALRTAFI